MAITIEELAAKVAELEQQMAAITDPPTEYYTSIFSGEEIDAAIKKVTDGIVGGVSSFNGRTGAVMPQSGDYNATQIPVSGEPEAGSVAAALSNKAPAGYGLGANGSSIPGNDLNNAILGGFYVFSSAVQNIPSFKSGKVLVMPYASLQYYTQIAFAALTSEIAFRFCNNGVWGPWEYLNPLLSPGVEYRTLERYNGKPVYMMALNFTGPLANSDGVQVMISGMPKATTKVIWSNAVIENTASGERAQLPSVDETGKVTAYVYARAEEGYDGLILGIMSTTDMSGWTAPVFVVKYVKTTD